VQSGCGSIGDRVREEQDFLFSVFDSHALFRESMKIAISARVNGLKITIRASGRTPEATAKVNLATCVILVIEAIRTCKRSSEFEEST
jgi:hypothetical protein